MAEILPIRPWRYNPALSIQIDALVSPLFDVVSGKQQAHLREEPLNSIHLSVPGAMGAAGAADLLAAWKASGVVIQDAVYGIYVYYQHFSLHGSPRQYCRKGFVAHIRAYSWDDGVILRHENTIPDAVDDRIELLDRMQLHASATHGLYTDPAFTLEKYMDTAMLNPIYETEDYQGVRDVLAVIRDKDIIKEFMNVMAGKDIILADGHHRYEASLRYCQQRKQANPAHTGKEGYNYHLMYFTNTEADDLVILPTHRLFSNLPEWNENIFLQKIHEYFDVKWIDDPDSVLDSIAGKPRTFGCLIGDKTFRITLKSACIDTVTWPFPELIKSLDLTLLHYFIVERILGIPGHQQRKSPNIHYERSFSECLRQVSQGIAQVALITNEVNIDDIKKVCRSGYTLPQKSTYFYPKTVAGLLFTSIRDDEFTSEWFLTN